MELVQRCILALTPDDGVVLDPFGGVGSTLLAASSTGRRGVMADLSDSYCALARDRLKMFQHGELKIRPLGKPVFEPTGREKVSQVPQEWIADPK